MKNPKFILKKSTDDRYYFILTAKNGEPILTSQMYQTKQGCKKGIESIKANAPEAPIEDLT